MIKQILQFIFIMNFAFMVAQTHRFVYKLDYQPDSLDVGSKKTEYFILTHSKTHSTFLSLNLHKRDSIASTLQKDFDRGTLTRIDATKMPKTDFKYQVLKTNDSVFVKQRIDRGNFYYVETTPLHWKINNDKVASIQGMKARYAEVDFSGRHFGAWFSDEIPVFDGPYIFKNLPGLILKIEDSKKHYSFELVQSYTVEDAGLELPKKILEQAKQTSKKKFYDAIESEKDNMINALKEMGGVVSIEQERNYHQRQKKKNNPLELKP